MRKFYISPLSEDVQLDPLMDVPGEGLKVSQTEQGYSPE